MEGAKVALAVEGNKVYNTTPAKKGMPAHSMKRGVAPATPLHPKRSNRMGDTNMSVPVTRPVHMATSPMNACHTAGLHLLPSSCNIHWCRSRHCDIERCMYMAQGSASSGR